MSTLEETLRAQLAAAKALVADKQQQAADLQADVDKLEREMGVLSNTGFWHNETEDIKTWFDAVRQFLGP